MERILIWKILAIGFALGLFTTIVYFNTNETYGCSREIGKKVVEYINENLIATGKVIFAGIIDKGSYCKVLMKYMGKNISVYVTKDGKTMFLQAYDLSKPLFDAPDSRKPEVKLFIMSFCPYGNQAEKEIAKVIEEIGDKINFEPVYILYDYSKYYNSKSKTIYIYGTTFNTTIIEDPIYGKVLIAYRHGSNCKYEGYSFMLTNSRTLWSMHDTFCVNNLSRALPKEAIEDVIEKIIYLKYGSLTWAKFIKEIDGKCNLDNILECWKAVAKEIGLDTTRILDYYKKNRDKILEEDYRTCEKYNAWGSPTLIINGVQYNGKRTSTAFRRAICSGFLNPPKECK